MYNSSDVGKTVTVEGRTLPANFDYTGEADYNSSSWSTLAYNGPINRTVLAWADGYAYLINALIVNIPTLKDCIAKLGTQFRYSLTAENSVVLDGSGSTCMRVNTGSKIENLGGDRYIYNMIRLTNSN